MDSVTDQLEDVLRLVQRYERAPATVLVCKLLEEAGVECSAIAEAADVMVTTMAILSRLYPDMPVDELLVLLLGELAAKRQRYEGRLNAGPWGFETADRAGRT
jgi:hypothetical protein